MMKAAALVLLLAAPAAQSSPEKVPISRVVGCLTQAPDGAWLLTDATDPAVLAGKPGSKEAAEPDAGAALGKNRFRIIGTVEEFGASKHKGHKVRVQGMLLTGQTSSINITSLRHLADICK
jgi:hypothetical protein